MSYCKLKIAKRKIENVDWLIKLSKLIILNGKNPNNSVNLINLINIINEK